jgi:hypothetical protein
MIESTLHTKDLGGFFLFDAWLVITNPQIETMMINADLTINLRKPRVSLHHMSAAVASAQVFVGVVFFETG